LVGADVVAGPARQAQHGAARLLGDVHVGRRVPTEHVGDRGAAAGGAHGDAVVVAVAAQVGHGLPTTTTVRHV
jgi:hypothetical protein